MKIWNFDTVKQSEGGDYSSRIFVYVLPMFGGQLGIVNMVALFFGNKKRTAFNSREAVPQKKESPMSGTKVQS